MHVFLYPWKGEAHGFTEPLAFLGVLKRPVEASNDAGSASGAVVTEHLDGNEVALLRNTIFCSPDGSGNVGSVAIFVCVSWARAGVGAPLGTAAKVLFIS